MVKLYQDKEWLKKKYIDEELSPLQIGRSCGVNATTVKSWIRKNNLSIRTLEESTHLRSLRLLHHCNLSQKAIEWINGELLGDGCLNSFSKYSAAIFYGSSKEKYINYVSKTLDSFEIKQSGRIRKKYYREMNCYVYHYSSLTYSELLPIRKQWYPEGKKIVPKDLELTPLMCRQWYIGDGYLGRSRLSNYIILCTSGFPILDVKFLEKELNNLGFKTYYQPSGNVIRISCYSTSDFLTYIGTCPVSCYLYKWNLLKNKRRI